MNNQEFLEYIFEKLENLDGFQDHRHDQSIITLLQLKHNLPCVMGHTGIRHFIKWNVLEHKDGVEYSNGVYDWDATGQIIQVQPSNDIDHSIILTVHNKGWLLPRVLDGCLLYTSPSPRDS